MVALTQRRGEGESFVIAKAGKPVAKVTPIVEKPIQRIGFMEGQFEVPHDIDTMFADDIADMFEGHHDGTGLFEKKS